MLQLYTARFGSKAVGRSSKHPSWSSKCHSVSTVHTQLTAPNRPFTTSSSHGAASQAFSASVLNGRNRLGLDEVSVVAFVKVIGSGTAMTLAGGDRLDVIAAVPCWLAGSGVPGYGT